MELNTTFAMGPSGKYYATGINRRDLLDLTGLSPFQKYTNLGTQNNGIDTDNRLNTVSEFSGVNTGRRALEEVNETIETISDEDILAGMEKAAEDIIAAYKAGVADLLNGNGGSGGYSRGGGGGGGGGSRGYSKNPLMPYLQAMKSPYWDNIPNIFADNPIIRRATIRRERFSSERGRLNQWQ